MAAGESARAMAQALREQADRLRTEAGNWDAGALGEERVAAALATADGQSIRVLHDRLLEPGRSEVNVDHLVVSTAGIFYFDTKNWIGDTTFYNESLWQHWTTPQGRLSANKKLELEKIRGMAARIQARCGHSVTPVLCLAGDGSERFGGPREVRGVQVVPIQHLLVWLQQRPKIWTPESVATKAVDLSMLFPPAVDAGLTIHEFAADAPSEAAVRSVQSEPRRSPKPGRRSRTVSAGPNGLARPVLALVALIAFAALAPTFIRAIGNQVVRGASAISNAPAVTQPKPTLSPARARALDDWRIRAGLYEANDQPSVLRYTPDAGLGSWSASCRDQLRTLKPFRNGLLRAPDRKLAAEAARFDKATNHLLHACVTDDPVALHHATSVMTAAAAGANARYNVLLGNDPTAVAAIRVL